MDLPAWFGYNYIYVRTNVCWICIFSNVVFSCVSLRFYGLCEVYNVCYYFGTAYFFGGKKTIAQKIPRTKRIRTSAHFIYVSVFSYNNRNTKYGIFTI